MQSNMLGVSTELLIIAVLMCTFTCYPQAISECVTVCFSPQKCKQIRHWIMAVIPWLHKCVQACILNYVVWPRSAYFFFILSSFLPLFFSRENTYSKQVNVICHVFWHTWTHTHSSTHTHAHNISYCVYDFCYHKPISCTFTCYKMKIDKCI